MPWFRVDDSFWSHPKVVQAGNAAIGLWVRCGSYCAQHLTDGFVPAWLVKQFGSPAQVRKLVDAGLWEPVDNPCGYLMHDWPEYQPTKQTVLIRRENDAERQRAFREKHQVNGTSHAVTNSAPTLPNPINGVAVVAPGTGRHARPADDDKRELALKQADQSQRQRTAKDEP